MQTYYGTDEMKTVETRDNTKTIKKPLQALNDRTRHIPVQDCKTHIANSTAHVGENNNKTGKEEETKAGAKKHEQSM